MGLMCCCKMAVLYIYHIYWAGFPWYMLFSRIVVRFAVTELKVGMMITVKFVIMMLIMTAER